MCDKVARTSALVMDYLKSRDIYCEKKPWEIRISPLGGRGIFATRDIAPGELIFVDCPVILGPRARADSREICVSCYKNYDLTKCYKNCGLPVCSNECADSNVHKMECSLINSWKKGDNNNNGVTKDLLRCLTPVRSLFLNEDDKNIVKLLKSHNDPSHGFEVDMLKERFNFKLNEEDEFFLRFVCSVLDSNAFEVVVGNESKHSALRGLYPLSGLANHNCSPNAMHVFDDKQRIIVRAAVAIPKGGEIFHSYVRIIWGTLTRRYLLYRTKHFCCNCDRCCDPSEFGGNVSGLMCQVCRQIALPASPLKLKSTWKCTNCDESIPESRIATIFSVLGGTVKNMEDTCDVNDILKFLDQTLSRVIAPTNQIAIELKYKLVWVLGYSPGYSWEELSMEHLERKEAICRELLDLLWLLRTGKSKMRGLLLYELYLCLREKQKRGSHIYEPEINNNVMMISNSEEDALQKLFDEASDIMMFDVGAPKEIKDKWPKISVFDL